MVYRYYQTLRRHIMERRKEFFERSLRAAVAVREAQKETASMLIAAGDLYGRIPEREELIVILEQARTLLECAREKILQSGPTYGEALDRE
jgi:hypothetical protein